MRPGELELLATLVRYALLSYQGDPDLDGLRTHVVGRVAAGLQLHEIGTPRLQRDLEVARQATTLALYRQVVGEHRALFASASTDAEGSTSCPHPEHAR